MRTSDLDPKCMEEDGRNGIVWWPEPPFDESAYDGRSKYGQHAAKVRGHFADCITKACEMAGVHRQERMAI